MILTEREFSTEANNIFKQLSTANINDFNSGKEKNKEISKYFYDNLPQELITKMKRNNIKVYLNFKKTNSRERVESGAHFAPGTYRDKPYIFIVLKDSSFSGENLRHEIIHAIDQVRQYPKIILTKEFIDLFDDSNNKKSKWDIQMDKFNNKEHKTDKGRNISREKLLGKNYYIYNSENIELNQRITDFVHKLKSHSFKTKIMNNQGYDDNLSNYKQLLNILFYGQESKKLINDKELKRYIIERFNREDVLKYINPEVFNSRISRNNKINQDKNREDKIITASSELKRVKLLKSPMNQDVKNKLEIYRKKKGLTATEIKDKKFITKANLLNKIENSKSALTKAGDDAMDAYESKNKLIKAKEELKNLYKNKGKFSVNTEETLEEGIKYFKTSYKLEKLSKSISNKLERVEEPEERRKVITLLNKIDRLSKKFEKLETDYKIENITKSGNPTAEKEFNQLTLDFADIIKIAKKEDTKNILKHIGSYSLLFAALTIPYKALELLAPLINPENSKIKKAITLIGMSIPFKLIDTNRIIEKGFKGYEMLDSANKSMENKNI